MFDNIYATGGRRFVLMNEAPLQFSPMYAAVANGGAGDNQYWQNKTLYNQTEMQNKMMEYTKTTNLMFDYGVPYNVVEKKRWPGASVTIFNVNGLLTDLHNTPAQFFGPQANVTGFFHHCVPSNNSQCEDSAQPASTFLW